MKKVVYRILEERDIPLLVSILIENWKFDQTSSEKNAFSDPTIGPMSIVTFNDL